MSRRRIRRLLVVTIVSSLALAAAADASTLRLRCAGRGPRNSDSAGTVLCAASPSRGRTIAGVVRNDAGQPVAATLTVTYRSWTPVRGGSGYTIRTRVTKQVRAKADGTFSFRSTTPTRESITVDVVPDAALGIAASAHAQTDVARRLEVSVTKLGGGSVRITVKGTRVRPVKVWILDPSGYQVPGVRPRNVNGRGQASFDLGSRRGSFSYYVDAGVYDDLFWYLGRPRFRL